MSMGCFEASARPRLRARPLEQLWRDHLLCGSLLLDRASGFDRGTFAVLYPGQNRAVGSALRQYQTCLSDSTTFRAWTLEEVLDALDAAGAGAWAIEARRRYAG